MSQLGREKVCPFPTHNIPQAHRIIKTVRGLGMLNKERLIGTTAILCLNLALMLMLSGQIVNADAPLSVYSVPVSVPPGTGWTQVFDDEFDGNALDASKWNTCFHWAIENNFSYCRGGNDELQW